MPPSSHERVRPGRRFSNLGHQPPRSRGWLRMAFARAVLTLTRWRMVGDFPNLPKLVIIAAPHRSNWDFVMAMLFVWAIRLRFQWLGKDSLFSGPLGRVFRACGGIPVDRSAARGAVGQIVARMAATPRIALAMAPEGTRKPVAHFKSGFYHIAHAAGVPILPVCLDYHRRTLFLMPLFVPNGNAEAEIPEIQARYAQLLSQGR